jgi:hypothetical protein
MWWKNSQGKIQWADDHSYGGEQWAVWLKNDLRLQTFLLSAELEAGSRVAQAFHLNHTERQKKWRNEKLKVIYSQVLG